MFSTVKTMSSSQAIEDNKKKATLLKDNSWIRKPEEEDEPVDRDPNFAKSVLGRYRPSDTSTYEVKTTKPVSSSSSVQALTKRFTSSQVSPTSPTSTSTNQYTKSRYSSLKSDSGVPTSDYERKTSSYTTKDGSKTETTIITTTVKSPTKTDAFGERVKASTKGSQYTSYSPTTTSKTIVTRTTSNGAEDRLYDSLFPSSLNDGSSSKTVTTTETVTVTSNTKAENNIYGSHGSEQAVSPPPTPEDKLYDSLLPKGFTSPTSTQKETVTVDSKGTVNTYYRTESSMSPYSNGRLTDDHLMESEFRSPTKTVYTSTKRTILERDLCSYCRMPFNGDAKIILDEKSINCHATCFKCQVCNTSLGHLKAGDNMWIYKSMVHCESCFESTRDKWRR